MERGGRVRSFVTGDTSKLTLQGLVGACVERGAVVNTDKFSGYGDLGEQLYRVMKPGGVVAMVIQDSTKNFAKTLTSHSGRL